MILKSSAAVAAGVYGMGWGLVDAADPPLEFDGSKFLLKAAEPNRRRPGSREPFTTAILFGAALATAA